MEPAYLRLPEHTPQKSKESKWSPVGSGMEHVPSRSVFAHLSRFPLNPGKSIHARADKAPKTLVSGQSPEPGSTQRPIQSSMKLRMSAASLSRKKRGVPGFHLRIRVIGGSILERFRVGYNCIHHDAVRLHWNRIKKLK